jgi:hypothetical protein
MWRPDSSKKSLGSLPIFGIDSAKFRPEKPGKTGGRSEEKYAGRAIPLGSKL